jgi:probable phosphomutase (TIGR03848 family)
MPTVLLIRHGENDYVRKGRLAGRKPGIHLNKTGISQAGRLTRYLAKTSLAAVYSSPLERTMETASPIAAVHDLDAIPCQGLLEVDFGGWQGKTLHMLHLRKLWKTVQHTPSLARFPSGESFAEAQQRMVAEILSLCARHKPKDMLVCVSHSDMIKLATAYFIGLPLDQFQRLSVQPGSITTLQIGEQGSRLVNLNFIPQDQPEGD